LWGSLEIGNHMGDFEMTGQLNMEFPLCGDP